MTICTNFHTITTTWWLSSVMLFVYLLLQLNISVKEAPPVYCLSFCDIWPPPSLTSDTLPVALSTLRVLSLTMEDHPVKDKPLITVVHQSNQLHNWGVNLIEISLKPDILYITHMLTHTQCWPCTDQQGFLIIDSTFLLCRPVRLCLCRCVSIFFVEFQSHFGSDYSATAWVHSLVDCTTMLCGQYPTPISQKSLSAPHCSQSPFLYVFACLRGGRVRCTTFNRHILWQGHRVDFIDVVCLNDRLAI